MADVKPRLVHRVQYAIGRTLLALLGAIPFNAARRVGRGLGRLAHSPFGVRRNVVERQIAGAFPEKDAAQIDTLSRDAFSHFGEVIIETALLPRLGRQGILDLFEGAEGFEGILDAQAEGKGIILITGHFGNWELAGAYVAARGVPIEVIVRRMNNPLFDSYVTRTRKGAGMIVVYDHDAVRRTPRAFRDGHAVAFVADQGVLGLASTFVPFFGRPAKTPRGPAVFAMKYRLPTFFVAAVQEASGKYRCVVTPVEIPDTGDREADIDTVVSRYTSILESWVRRYPGQYFWHHRRWKRQPPDTPDELRDPVSQSPGPMPHAPGPAVGSEIGR